MKPPDIVRIDGIKWWITKNTRGVRIVIPLCPQHNLKLKTKSPTILECDEELHTLEIPRNLPDEKAYVINRVNALAFSKMITINLDDEVVPVAEQELKKDSPYWVKAKVTESKSGTRLIVWAGDRSKKNKTQLFVEPKLKRLSFDQNDDHPTEVFTKVEATFSGDHKSIIEKKIAIKTKK